MFTLFVAAFVLGLGFNAAPGAVFAETVRRGIRGGFRPALAVQLGSLVGDALWALLGLGGVGLLWQVESLRLPIGLAGVAYLLWLSIDAWRSARIEFGQQAPAPGPGVIGAGGLSSQRAATRAGVILSVTNPQNIAYWAALGSAMGSVGIAEPTPAHQAVFFAGFMAASIVWAFVCAGLVARLFRNPSAGWAKLTYRLCAAAFLALALASLRGLVVEARARESSPPSVVAAAR